VCVCVCVVVVDCMQGYALHVQGATGEWLMGILFIIYPLTFLPEFRKFTIHVKLEPLDNNVDDEESALLPQQQAVQYTGT